jgi:hypothetical protein
MNTTSTLAERCDLLDLDGIEFANDVVVRWFDPGRQGQIEFPCKDVLARIPEPISFYLSFHEDWKRLQVLSSKYLLECTDVGVPFLVAAPRR